VTSISRYVASFHGIARAFGPMMFVAALIVITYVRDWWQRRRE